jgi:anti-sigma28 factor (negative regulator of flagellin synthesis)
MINGLNSGNIAVNSRITSRDSLNTVQETNNNSGGDKVQETARISRVEQIKNQIQAGEYQINIDRTSQKLAESLIF